MKHGYSAARHGRCACDVCRAANAEYQRRYTARLAERRSDPTLRHGTWSTYTNYKCRCDLCLAEGSRVNAANYAARLRAAGK